MKPISTFSTPTGTLQPQEQYALLNLARETKSCMVIFEYDHNKPSLSYLCASGPYSVRGASLLVELDDVKQMLFNGLHEMRSREALKTSFAIVDSIGGRIITNSNQLIGTLENEKKHLCKSMQVVNIDRSQLEGEIDQLSRSIHELVTGYLNAEPYWCSIL